MDRMDRQEVEIDRSGEGGASIRRHGSALDDVENFWTDGETVHDSLAVTETQTQTQTQRDCYCYCSKMIDNYPHLTKSWNKIDLLGLLKEAWQAGHLAGLRWNP